MRQLEQLTVQYLEAAIKHRNVLLALQNASQLKLDSIKVSESVTVQKYSLCFSSRTLW